MARAHQLAWLCALTMIVSGTVTGVAPAGAYAATACTTADPYAHRVVTPSPAVAGARFGATSVSGDFNKDGYADVAVGAPGDTVGGVAGGSVTEFKGSANGLVTRRGQAVGVRGRFAVGRRPTGRGSPTG